MSKTDFSILKRGCKRTLFAVLTAALLGLSVWGFIATATAKGYVAVLSFLVSVFALGMALMCLYIQGIVRGKYVESKGEKDE